MFVLKISVTSPSIVCPPFTLQMNAVLAVMSFLLRFTVKSLPRWKRRFLFSNFIWKVV